MRESPPAMAWATGPTTGGRCSGRWRCSPGAPASATAILRAEGRAVESLRRSVELDVIVTEADEALDPLLARFGAARGVDRGHLVLRAVLAGDGVAITERMGGYQAAGATDLMLGFADFPSTRMLELFADAVLRRRQATPGA